MSAANTHPGKGKADKEPTSVYRSDRRRWFPGCLRHMPLPWTPALDDLPPAADFNIEPDWDTAFDRLSRGPRAGGLASAIHGVTDMTVLHCCGLDQVAVLEWQIARDGPPGHR